jgi:FkbM family methyltransferase
LADEKLTETEGASIMLEQLAIWLGRNLTVRGSGRLLSALYPCKQGATRYLQGVRVRSDGLLMELDSRNWIDWNLLFRGKYEPHITRLLQRLARVGGVAVDIGANIGTHTLTLARTLGPTGMVLAFEPNPLVQSVLERNVALNSLLGVQVFDCALGDKAGVLPLRVPKAESVEYSNMGLVSLVALDSPHDLVAVEVRTLDEVVRQAGCTRVDLVKIDVQGYECRVLTGMQEVLAQHSPVVIFEYEEWA